MFSLTLKTTRASEGRRHAFAHHIWGTSELIPDALLLLDARSLVKSDAARREFSAQGPAEVTGAQPGFFDLDKIQVFSERDLQDDVASAARASQVVSKLWLLVSHMNEPLAATLRHELMTEPLVRQAFQVASSQTVPGPST